METTSDLCQTEQERLAIAYGRRESTIPPDRYSLTNLGNLLNHQERERVLLRFFARQGYLGTSRILEVGCGTGFWLREFVRYGAQPENLVGIELLPDRVATARRLCAPGVTVIHGDAASLEFADESFDIVFQSTVFSSVLDCALRRRIASEMLRVTKRSGVVLWYDFFANNPANPDVVGISRNEIRTLFQGCHISLRRLTLLPPLARKLGPTFPFLCRIMSSVTLLSTHYLGIIEKV
jgi:ubiquinone/menaquinone biosynthesis C-methylase UbiE